MRNNGVYQWKYTDCQLKYTGKTGRTFYTRYKEHIQAIRKNNSNLGYSKHILSAGHAYGSIIDTIKIMKIEKKGKHLKTLEIYHIHNIYKNRLHMNDAYNDVYNTIFKTLQELNIR
jgi:hypothetical protein